MPLDVDSFFLTLNNDIEDDSIKYCRIGEFGLVDCVGYKKVVSF